MGARTSRAMAVAASAVAGLSRGRFRVVSPEPHVIERWLCCSPGRALTLNSVSGTPVTCGPRSSHPPVLLGRRQIGAQTRPNRVLPAGVQRRWDVSLPHRRPSPRRAAASRRPARAWPARRRPPTEPGSCLLEWRPSAATARRAVAKIVKETRLVRSPPRRSTLKFSSIGWCDSRLLNISSIAGALTERIYRQFTTWRRAA